MGDASGEYSVPSGLVHYGFVQSTPFWVSGYEEDPDRGCLNRNLQAEKNTFPCGSGEKFQHYVFVFRGLHPPV